MKNMEFDREAEYRAIIEALEKVGEDTTPYTAGSYASIVVNGDRVLMSKGTEGIEVEAETMEDGTVEVRMVVKKAVRAPLPVHICFGVLKDSMVQRVRNYITVEDGASVSLVSHCFFPNAVRVEHISEGYITIGKNARFVYTEEHYHSDTGGVVVRPMTRVHVRDGGEYENTFALKKGRMGELYIDYEADLSENARALMLTKVYGRGDDVVNAREVLRLNGKNSSGIIKTRVALRDDATSEVVNITEGNAEGARGHVDCTEILMDNARATSIPQITATHPRAKVTHEAAIGSIDRKQLQTLMARGLSEEESVDIIVGGLLR